MVKSPVIRINIRALSNEVFAHFFTDVVKFIDKFGAGAIGIKQTSDDLKASVVVLKSVLDTVRKSEFTKKLEIHDKFRDELSRGLTAMVKSFLYSPEGNETDAANGLNLLFDHYWSLPKRSYDAESEAIADLFGELDKTENVARVALLGLTAGIARFRVANTKFEELMTQRYDQISARPDITMKEARADVKEKFDLMLYRLDGVIAISGLDSSEELSGFVREYNVVVTRYKQILAQEQGRRKAAREKGEHEEDPDNEENDDNNTPEFPDEQ